MVFNRWARHKATKKAEKINVHQGQAIAKADRLAWKQYKKTNNGKVPIRLDYVEKREIDRLCFIVSMILL